MPQFSLDINWQTEIGNCFGIISHLLMGHVLYLSLWFLLRLESSYRCWKQEKGVEVGSEEDPQCLAGKLPWGGHYSRGAGCCFGQRRWQNLGV